MIIQNIFSMMSNMLFFALHLSGGNSFSPPLSAKEEYECLKAAEKGDTAAKNRLIEHNLRLVAHIIKKYYSNSSQQEDLISIGTIGLIKAINSFNADRGTRLATYAARCIENEILMHFRAQKKTAQDISMSEPIDTDSEGNPLTLMDIIATDDEIIEDIYKMTMIKRLSGEIAKITDEREKTIIVLRYGLNGGSPLTQLEVAKKLNISRSYVSRIEKRVLSRLKKALDN